MSALDVRLALSQAANTVDGINCQPYFRQATRAGDAMVRLDHIDYPNVFGGVVSWQVAVLLPQDITQAEKFTDEKVPALVAALAGQMNVTRVTPAQLALDTGTVPVVFLEGTREEE